MTSPRPTARTAAPPAPRGRGQPRGYTLVELLVVVLVVAVMVGIAGIPVSADGPAVALDLAEVQLQDAFEVAQTLAYSMETAHGVVFDVVGNRFAVVAVDGTAVTDPLTHGAYEVDFDEIVQPAGLEVVAADFGSTGAAAVFDGAGVPVAAGSVTLRKGGVSRQYVLDAATGRIAGS